jgi:hypothetical protein
MNSRELKIYNAYRALYYRATDSIKATRASVAASTSDSLEHDLSRVFSIMVAVSYVMAVLWRLTYVQNAKLWVTTPKGKRSIQLPLYVALRLVRSRNFTFTKVEPTRTISRREALRILIHGDKRQKGGDKHNGKPGIHDTQN